MDPNDRIIELLKAILARLEDIDSNTSSTASEASSIESNTSNLERELSDIKSKLDYIIMSMPEQ